LAYFVPTLVKNSQNLSVIILGSEIFLLSILKVFGVLVLSFNLHIVAFIIFHVSLILCLTSLNICPLSYLFDASFICYISLGFVYAFAI